jgi:hypothetical protein
LYQWSKEVREHLAGFSRPQAFMLAALSLGVVLARCCGLRRAAEALFSLGKPDTVERRFQRFLSNEGIKLEAGCMGVSRWVLESLPAGLRQFGGLVTLLVDETSLNEHLKVMVVSLAYQGKAIPLAWWCYRQEAYPMSQVKLILTLLRWVAKGMPPGVAVLVEADRGIGTSPSLLAGIRKLGWHYLVRVQGLVHLLLKDGREVAMTELVHSPGECWEGEAQAFKKAGWIKCKAIAYWGKGHEEPWLLLTSYPKAEGNWYGVRMWEELAFRDLKSFGWGWDKSKVWKPEHAGRLWLVMALAYALALSLGSRAMLHERLWRELARGKKSRTSLFRLGLRFVSRCANLGRDLFYHLAFSLDPTPGLKSVVQ